MKIGYGEALAAPSTVGVHRIAEPTGSGRVSSTLPGSAGPSTGRGIASAARGRAALLRTGSIPRATLQLPRRGCRVTWPEPAGPPRTITAWPHFSYKLPPGLQPDQSHGAVFTPVGDTSL